MRRRLLLAAGIAPFLAAIAKAQTPQKTFRVGFLAPRQRTLMLSPVINRLSELGFVQGKNLVLEFRSSDGVEARFASLARELLEAGCDLIFAGGTVQAARAFVDAKAPVPIVFIAVDYDPIRSGIVSNLRRPGGDLTGVTLLAPELVVKQVEILRELLPRAKRLLVLSDPYTEHQVEPARRAAEHLRLEIIPVTFAALPYEFGSAFEHGRKSGADALLLLTSPVFTDHRETIYGLATKHRLPLAVGWSVFWAGSGWLVGYGPNANQTFARAGDIAASILKGKRAGDIPVEQPTQFELAINLKTAKALGIKIPQTILTRADRLIE